MTYLCADRWMQNHYGQRLRRLIEDRFSLDAIVTLHDCDVYDTRVNAYPALVTLTATIPATTLRVHADPSFGPAAAIDLATHYRAPQSSLEAISKSGAGEIKSGYTASWTTLRPSAGRGWPMGQPGRIALVERLEGDHPALGDPESGVDVGIGITTGADAIFLTSDPHAAEPERLRPLVTAADLSTPTSDGGSTYLMDPWEPSGDLVDLDEFPRLANYFRAHEDRLPNRHIGKRLPHQWYRTIDREIPGLRETPKLLVADLRPRVTPALDHGHFCPHHNLFWITSTEWDLEVLGGLLISDYGNAFIETYAPRMTGAPTEKSPLNTSEESGSPRHTHCSPRQLECLPQRS